MSRILDLPALKREIRRTVRRIDPSARRVELVIMDSDGQTTRSEINLWVPPADEPQSNEPSDATELVVKPGRGFRSIRVVDTVYPFTATQARAVALLYEAWEHGTYDVPDSQLLAAARTEAIKVSDVFRGSSAWGTLIIEGGSRGTHRFTMPGEAFE